MMTTTRWMLVLGACALSLVGCDDSSDDPATTDAAVGGMGGEVAGGSGGAVGGAGGEMGGAGGDVGGAGGEVGGAGGDVGGAGGEMMPDMEVPDASIEEVLCARYCDVTESACAGSNQLYETREGCMNTCMGFSFDGEEGDVSGDTVQCRIYHAEVAEQVDPFFHCNHAGADGGGVCVDDPAPLCETYCGLMLENCQGTYEDADACLAECAHIPDDGAIGDQMGDTVQCRLLYATQAGAMPEDADACLNAGPLGNGVCGLPTGQIDRMGRPAINTALISSENKDAYNQSSPAEGAQFIDEMTAALAFVDGLDGNDTNGLLADSRADLAGLLAADVLLINTAIDNCSGGYLALELGLEGNCGGRTLEQDVIDTTLQALVDASGTVTVTDAVDNNDLPFNAAFPYLPAPADDQGE